MKSYTTSRLFKMKYVTESSLYTFTLALLSRRQDAARYQMNMERASSRMEKMHDNK